MLRRLVALSLLSLPLAGCLQGRQEVAVAADGSGTIKQSFGVDVAKAKELFEMLQMLFGTGEVAADQMPDPFAETWWRKLAEGVEGYTLGDVTDETKDGRRTVTTAAKFTSMQAAAKAGAFFFSAVSLEKLEGGGWKLVFKDSLAAAKEAAGSSGGGMDFGSLLLGFEPQLGTLSLARVVSLPGKVTETNGTLSEDGKTVTWTVDFQRIVEGKDLELSITFTGDDKTKLEPFAYKPDGDGLMRRFTEAAPKPPAPPVPPEGGGR